MSEIQIKKIMLPIDGSDASIKAARYAVKIAKQEKAQIICIHAIGTPAYISEYRTPFCFLNTMTILRDLLVSGSQRS